MPPIRGRARRVAAAALLLLGLLVGADCGGLGTGEAPGPMNGVDSAVNLLDDDQRAPLEEKYGPHPD